MSMCIVICLKHVGDGQLVLQEFMRWSPASFLTPPHANCPRTFDSALLPICACQFSMGIPMQVIDSYQHVLFWCVTNLFLSLCIKAFNFILFSWVKWKSEEKNRKRTHTVVYHCLCCEVWESKPHVLSSVVSQSPNRKKCELPLGLNFLQELFITFNLFFSTCL